MRSFHACAGLVLAGGLVFPASGWGAVETQSFDSEASAAAAGWATRNTTIGTNDYGWSNTNNVGAPATAGEAGGVVARIANDSINDPQPDITGKQGTYYADLTIGTLDLTMPISASGRIIINQQTTQDAFLTIGFFNKDNYSEDATWKNINYRAGNGDVMGINIRDGDNGKPRWGAHLLGASPSVTTVGPGASDANGFDEGTYTKVGYQQEIRLNNLTTYLFSIEWDPTYNEGGSVGRLMTSMHETDGTLWGISSAVVFFRESDGRYYVQNPNSDGQNLTDRFTEVEFNAFGITTRGSTNNDYVNSIFGTVFIDDLTYTVVPEPASLALLGAAGVLGTMRRRNRAARR